MDRLPRDALVVAQTADETLTLKFAADSRRVNLGILFILVYTGVSKNVDNNRTIIKRLSH